jgi:XRE family transcriptional regulator, fatty acid utilization regulator
MPRTVSPPPGALAEFGRRVRHHRKRLGLTQETVARAVGVKRAPICAIERGVSGPSFGMVLALARVFRVDPATLVRGLHRLGG